MKHFLGAAALALAATGALADGIVSYDTDQSFDDVVFGLENAILDAGLVIDSVSHTGDMLERTKADVGSDVTIFTQADIFSFCSAKISREVMEANPMNVVFCPYDIFVIVRPETPDTTTIGFRSYPEGEMKKVEKMLDDIARAAIGID
ncbi:DUF302 domain-containing protein [Mameliella sediminis]|uniref:DUF302 domain-containing protein n=1 Tax=Mameliella sediminis TaxID=2836866 RepID=UPI001C486835|nr:DUF302 domain-containing protein [Mameliella sediminis]MBY6117425.1 DUF302 domain-containing protein [Antarctobacter heliothermus]MBY6147282.1 DUF302 domain-containing protein [Mameliella alba]MBV7397434.1 DUF302 domain-containing protein [Mameliella sediminis]MBY6164146.1 DUF302 domain-containing protein [Mameliella alba]MBY6172635.1 DUF302 domain-containing protein [Mameliella alba]